MIFVSDFIVIYNQLSLKVMRGLFERRSKRIPTVIILGTFFGLLIVKAEDSLLLTLIALLIFFATPVFLYLFVAEEDKNKRFMRLLKYLIPFFVFSGIGYGIGEQVFYTEEQRQEINRLKQEEDEIALKLKKEKLAEEKRQKIIAAENEARKKEEVLRTYNYKTSIESISNEFESNSIIAEDKYKGNRIYMTGTVYSIDDSLFSEKNVNITIVHSLTGDYIGNTYFETPSSESVSCEVKRSNPIVRQISKGQRIGFIGKLTGEEFGLSFSDCWFQL